MIHLKEKSAFDFIQVLRLTRYLNGHKGYIAGGCFKNIFKGEKIRDIDVFFEHIEDFNEALKIYEEDDNFREVYENENAVGFYDTKGEITVELVKSQLGTPENMIDGFDFTITKFALHKRKVEPKEIDKMNIEQTQMSFEDFLGDGFKVTIEESSDDVFSDDESEEDDYEVLVTYHELFFEHLMLNRLVVDNDLVDFPLNTFERIIKYSKYGYTPCTGTKAKIVRMVNSMSLPEDDADLFKGFYAGID